MLAIVGTKGPFPRLTEAVSLLAKTTGWRVLVQHASHELPAGLEGWSELPREALLQEIDRADAVVCHAGSGTIRDAIRAGHRPIVVPRLARHGEHVNDHQLELVTALADRITPIGDLAAESLAHALRDAIAVAKRSPPRVLPGDALRAALEAEIADIARERPTRRSRLLYAVLGRLVRPSSASR